MDRHIPPEGDADDVVQLDQHDSVRTHVCRRLSDEVTQLEQRVASLKRTRAPHAALIIATYQRMIDRKKGFMQSWGLKCLGSSSKV